MGENGLVDAGETTPDSGEINFDYSDTSGNGSFNFVSSDSDGDGCSDVIEAGFMDGNGDDYLGDTPPTVDSDGIVINASDGYELPNGDYLIYAPIIINTQPMDTSVCDGSDIQISIDTNTIDAIFWELSTNNGVSWVPLNDGGNYTNTKTSHLSLINMTASFSGNLYRAVLSKNGNTCGLISEEVVLTVEPLPIVTASVTLKQCDNNTDGFSPFNLNEANEKISSNYLNETFTFYETLADAQNNLNQIPNPNAYTNKTVNTDQIWDKRTKFNAERNTKKVMVYDVSLSA